jgi:hypothetical protein
MSVEAMDRADWQEEALRALATYYDARSIVIRFAPMPARGNLQIEVVTPAEPGPRVLASGRTLGAVLERAINALDDGSLAELARVVRAAR